MKLVCTLFLLPGVVSPLPFIKLLTIYVWCIEVQINKQSIQRGVYDTAPTVLLFSSWHWYDEYMDIFKVTSLVTFKYVNQSKQASYQTWIISSQWKSPLPNYLKNLLIFYLIFLPFQNPVICWWFFHTIGQKEYWVTMSVYALKSRSPHPGV